MAETQPLVTVVQSPGLTQAEAERRLRERGPLPPAASSRSLASIVRANVFTVFNLILVGFGVLTFAFGHFEDALFIAILAANASIGILQEYRAKRSLDRLAALVAPHATVVRDGEALVVPVEEVVVGDLVRVASGDQVVADGRIELADGLTLDESILTGESQPMTRHAGDEIRSGTFAAEGSGAYVVTAVGPDSYAEKVADVAREFRHPRSPLELALNHLLIALVVVTIPLGALFGYALFERDEPLRDAVTTSVAGVVTLIPEGLILLTSLTYAVAALRMTRRGALTQQLSAIESIASVDVICLDKTGTLTESALRLIEVVPAGGYDQAFAEKALARYAASDPAPNATLDAIAERLKTEPELVSGSVPFSSQRKWSGLRLGATGLVLGAPEHFALGALADRVATEQRAGRRVLALATTASRLDGPVSPDERPPADARPLAVAILAEQLRPNARETVAYFLEQGVELKVISGDAPETVAAIARDVGIPVDRPVDGSRLPDDPHALRRLALDATVVGRISPDGKRRLVEALRDSGRFVAMVGDGVNDVPALKAARLGIAQGSGTQMAKSVADLVLVKGDFSAVPQMVGEGRKILRNLQRVARLFVTKSAFAAFLILTVGLTDQEYPLLPRHLTLVASLAIGFPAFFLALAPSGGPWHHQGFLRDIARFAIPAGTAAGLGVVASYQFALNVLHLDRVDVVVPTLGLGGAVDGLGSEAQTVATTVLMITGLYFILVLEASGRVRGALVSGLCATMLLLYALVLAFPTTRGFFDLAAPNAAIVLCAIGGSAVTIVGLALMDERFVPGHALAGVRGERDDSRPRARRERGRAATTDPDAPTAEVTVPSRRLHGRPRG